MTEGQRQALQEVRTAAARGAPAIEFVSSRMDGAALLIDVTLDCAGVAKAEAGIPLRQREPFTLVVPPNFPLKPPSVKVPHERWKNHHHVQWLSTLCLYQAPTTEWVPSDGMFGFLERLWLFVTRAAADTLDDWGAPLHPPVAYQISATVPTVIIRADTPAVGSTAWCGVAKLDLVHERRMDVTAWARVSDAEPGLHAAAFLLPTKLPFEYPSTVGHLTSAFEAGGVLRELWLLVLEWAAQRVEDGQPLLVLVGTPMRGVRGGRPVQHLAAWYVAPVVASCLRDSILKFSEHAGLKELGARYERIAVEWTEKAPVEWCRVREDRPEATRRRDSHSAMRAFAGRSISLRGCGALGSAVAEHVVRAGARKLELIDSGDVGPGLLVRQRFEDIDIGRNKATALAERLRRIDGRLEVSARSADLLALDLEAVTWGAADVVIDATASLATAALLERQRIAEVERPPIVSMMVGHLCDRGLVSVVMPESRLGPLSAIRAAKLQACRDPLLQAFMDEFWPESPRGEVFQPEPGCSDATFQGSAAEVDVLAAMMILEAARLLKTKSSRAAFVANPVTGAEPALARVSPQEPTELADERLGYRVLIERDAEAEIDAAIADSRLRRGREVETGGALFGQRDDAARIVWVSKATGPPADSTASSRGFECGTSGLDELAAELKHTLRGAMAPIGMWHTHPNDRALPSITDHRGMAQILFSRSRPHRRQLLLIIGRQGRERRAFLYDREQLLTDSASAPDRRTS